MRLALDTLSELLVCIPRLSLDYLQAAGGRKKGLARDRQRALMEILWTAYRGDRPHATTPGAVSFTKEYLVEKLHVARKGNRERHLLRPFLAFPDGKKGYSRTSGITRPYGLHPHIRAALDHVVSGNARFPVYDLDTGMEVHASSIPANGIPSTVAPGVSVPSILPIPEVRVDRAVERFVGWLDNVDVDHPLDPRKPRGRTMADGLRVLRGCRMWIRSLGGLPNFYAEQNNGRLGPVTPTGIHMIQIPRLLRSMLYEGSGMRDYDISRCHLSTFRCLAERFDFDAELVNDYVENRDNWHTRWCRSTQYQGDPNDFKPVVLSFLTGGQLSQSPDTANAQLLSPRVVAELQRDKYAVGLRDEIQSGMRRAVIAAASLPDGNGIVRVQNAIGKTLTLTDSEFGGHGNGWGRAASHLLTGFEQYAIRHVCKYVHNLQAIIYDGFIAPEQDIAQLNAHLADLDTGFMGLRLNLTLSSTDLSAPVPDMECDDDSDGDF